MKLKKLILLSLLTVGLFSGSSISVNASQQNNDDELKELQSSYLNNLKTGSGKFKHTLTGTFDPRMQKTSSQKRKNNYQLIKTQKIKRQYFFFKNSDLKKGNLYSKNLKNKYTVNIKSFEEPMVYADQKMTLYNKKTHKYNIYYHIKSVNSEVSGWTWNINLRKYQSLNSQNKKVVNSFQNSNSNNRMQVIVNQLNTIGNTDIWNGYMEANTDIKTAFPFDAKIDTDDYNTNKRVIIQLRQGKISYSSYVHKILNKYKNHFGSLNNTKIGIYSYPKSSNAYGSFIIIGK